MTTANLTLMGSSSATATKASGFELCILGSGGLVEFRHGPVDAAQKSALDQKIDAFGQKCIQQFNTKDIMIYWGRVVSITYKDQQGQMSVANLNKQVPAHLAGLQQDANDINTSISALYKDIKWSEPLGQYPDEEGHHASFHALGKMPVRSFMRSEHFGSAKGFAQNVVSTATVIMDQLLASEVFVQVLEDEARKLMEKQQKAVKQNPTQQEQQKLHSLEQFLEEVRQADLYAMYWAIGAKIEAACPGPAARSDDFEGRAKVAGRIREGMSEALISKLARKGSKSADMAEINMYAREVSSLAFHDQAENLEKIRQENSQGQAIRCLRRPPMTEFLVYNMMNLCLPASVFDPAESLTSRGYLDPDLVTALGNARQAAEARLRQVAAIQPALSYDQRLKVIPK